MIESSLLVRPRQCGQCSHSVDEYINQISIQSFVDRYAKQNVYVRLSFFTLFEVKLSTLFDVLAECGNWRHLPSRTERSASTHCGYRVRTPVHYASSRLLSSPEPANFLVGGHPTGTSKFALQPLDSRFGDLA